MLKRTLHHEGSATELDQVATEFNLSDETVRRLRSVIDGFKNMPASSRKQRTPREKSKALEDIVERMRSLERKLRGLSNEEALPLDLQLHTAMLYQEPLRKSEGTLTPTQDAILEILDRWAVAFEHVIDLAPNDGRKGGRRSNRSFRMGFVMVVAAAVRASGMKASAAENSRFKRVCRACFRDAGLAIDPDGTVDEFARDGTRADYVKLGYCL